MTNLKKTLKLKNAPIVFSNLAVALSYAQRANNSLWVMLGDNNKFWLVCPSDAAKLEAVGYSFAN